MAFLRKYIDKYTYILLVTVWNGLSVWIPNHVHWAVDTIVLVNLVGNAVIAWLGVESGNKKKEKKQ